MIVLDTNVISELMRPEPSVTVAAWMAGHPATGLFTTCVNEAEIRLGIASLPDGRRRRAFAEAADAMFRTEFAGRVLSFDSAAARAFAEIAAGRRRQGKPIGHADAQIAAIARAHGAAVATRNVGDFVGCGIAVVDPWRP